MKRRNWLRPEPVRSPVESDPYRRVGDSWLKPGEQHRVWVYVSGSLTPEEAISAAKRMVVAHELCWERLHALIFEKTGKGNDAIRWAVDVLVSLSEQAEPQTEALL